MGEMNTNSVAITCLYIDNSRSFARDHLSNVCRLFSGFKVYVLAHSSFIESLDVTRLPVNSEIAFLPLESLEWGLTARLKMYLTLGLNFHQRFPKAGHDLVHPHEWFYMFGLANFFHLDSFIFVSRRLNTDTNSKLRIGESIAEGVFLGYSDSSESPDTVYVSSLFSLSSLLTKLTSFPDLGKR